MAARPISVEPQPLRLNLGCSDAHVKGWANVDLCAPADVIADLSQTWPWSTSVVDEIKAWDIFEHMPDKILTMNECHRVLAPGGQLDLFIPTTDGRGAFQDPTHKSWWTPNDLGWVLRNTAGGHQQIMAHAGSVPYFIRFTLPDGSSMRIRVANFDDEKDILRQYRDAYGSPVTLRARTYARSGSRKKKNPTKAQKREKTRKVSAKRRVAVALAKFLKQANPAMKTAGASIQRLKGGVLKITPIRANAAGGKVYRVWVKSTQNSKFRLDSEHATLADAQRARNQFAGYAYQAEIRPGRGRK